MQREEIRLQVDETAARIFESASQESRRETERMVTLHLLSLIEPDSSVDQTLEDLSRAAAERGMTPQNLRDILGDDELEGCL